MSHRVAASALVIALSLAFASTSGAEDMRSSHLRGKLTVPVTGLIAGGGSFSGTLTITDLRYGTASPSRLGRSAAASKHPQGLKQ